MRSVGVSRSIRSHLAQEMVKLLLARPVVHVTVAVAVPGSVLVPIFHDQVTFPSAFAVE